MGTGRYIDAPLIYVAAAIRLNNLGLTEEQRNLIGQALLDTRYRKKKGEEEPITEVNMQQGGPRINQSVMVRDAYFSFDSSHAIIVNIKDSVIEFRSTKYTGSDDFLSMIWDAILKMSAACPALGKLPVEEIVFNYVDIIAPSNGRVLSDYFAGTSVPLPLTPIESHVKEDLFQGGATRYTRVIGEGRTRVDVEIEQRAVKTNKGKRLTPKVFPDSLAEPNTAFAQPTQLPKSLISLDKGSYVILWTRAGMLPAEDFSFSDDKVFSYCKDSHALAKACFNELIDHDICGHDWKFEKKRVN